MRVCPCDTPDMWPVKIPGTMSNEIMAFAHGIHLHHGMLLQAGGTKVGSVYTL